MGRKGRKASAVTAVPAATPDVYDPTAAEPDAPAPEVAPAPQPAEGAEGGGAVSMYDGSGNAVQVDQAKAPSLFLSGQTYFAQGQKVHVKDGNRIYSVSPEEARQALKSGMGLATEEDVAAAQERKSQNTIGKSLEAGAVGVGRGLTLGLSDPLAIGATKLFAGDDAGEALRKHLRDLKEHHGIASTVGELGGAIAPVLLSGGAGAGVEGAEAGFGLGSAIRGAGVLPRAAAGLGELAGEGVGHMVGSGATSLLGRVAQRAIPMAAQAGAEGAVYGAGSTISEASLGDEELTAERLLAGTAHGAMLGAITGGALGAGYEVGKAGLDKGLKLIGKEGLQEFFQDMANRQTGKTLGVSSRDYTNLAGVSRSAENAEQRMGEIAETVRGYHFEDGKKLFSGTSTTSKLADGLQEAVEESGAKLGKFRQKISQMSGADSGLAPDVQGFFRKFDQEIIAPSAESPLLAGRAAKAENELLALRQRLEPLAEGTSQAPVTLDELGAVKKRLDKILFPKKVGGIAPPPPEHMEQLFQARQLLEQEIEATTDRVVAASGNQEMAGAYQTMKREYRDLTQAKQMAQAADLRAAARNSVSLSDKMAFGSVAAGGGLAGLPGAAAAGMLNSAANKYGNAMLATAADKAATIIGIQKAASHAEEHMGSAINAFLSDRHEAGELAEKIGHVSREGMKTALEKREEMVAPRLTEEKAEKPATQEGQFSHAAAALGRMENPAVAHQVMASKLAPIATHAPNIAQAAAGKMSATAAYLAAQLPKNPLPAEYPTASLKDVPNDVARAKFLRQEGGTSPQTVATHLSKGELSHDEVEAFKTTSPKMYQQAAEQLMSTMADRAATGDTVDSIEKHLQLTTFLGKPTHPALSSKFIKSVQAMRQQAGSAQPQAGAPAMPGAPKRQINIAGSFAARSSALESNR